MIGVLINGAAVLFGGFIGLLFKKGIPESIEKSMNKSLGLVVIIIGINGVVSNMFHTQTDGSLHSSGELLLVVSFTLGTLAGEIFMLDDKINAFSNKIEHKFKIQGFTAGFITASSICCIGAMGIIGSLTSGLTLIICVGLNLMTNIKFKTVNMLPSLLIPVIYYGIRILFKF